MRAGDAIKEERRCHLKIRLPVAFVLGYLLGSRSHSG
jgi:hypothetical protein